MNKENKERLAREAIRGCPVALSELHRYAQRSSDPALLKAVESLSESLGRVLENPPRLYMKGWEERSLAYHKILGLENPEEFIFKGLFRDLPYIIEIGIGKYTEPRRTGRTTRMLLQICAFVAGGLDKILLVGYSLEYSRALKTQLEYYLYRLGIRTSVDIQIESPKRIRDPQWWKGREPIEIFFDHYQGTP